jgi:hypothetical protein
VALVLVWPLCLASACAQLGLRDRVLARVPSPDGQFIAVCQEVPALDGPNHDLRLERPEGGVAARIWSGGDNYGCGDITWSPDGRMLAILIRHMSTVVVLNTEWARAHLDIVPPVPWRQFTFSTDRILYRAKNLRFSNNGEIEVTVCESRIKSDACIAPDETRRFAVEPPPESTIRR